MSVFFISDLHLGHRTILEHCREVGSFRGGTTTDEHDEWVIAQMLSVKSNKRTLWYILGDVAMEETKLEMLTRVPGRKILLPGNHDLFKTAVYLPHFEAIMGSFKKYDFWISHIPVHPAELRGHPNVHGHCHNHTLKDDPRYLNCALEWLPKQRPISLDEIRATWLPLALEACQ